MNKEKNIELVSTLLKGIKRYSRQEIDHERLRIIESYTVVVDSSLAGNKLVSPKTILGEKPSYSGIVRTGQELKDSLVEVILIENNVQSYYSERVNNGILIFCFDREKGLIKKRGNLILLNSFGQRVAVPFEFSYHNELAK